MLSVHDAGWRQGSVFSQSFPVGTFDLADGVPAFDQSTHTRWVVTSQDCDLASADVNSGEALIEIQPVHGDTVNADWGVRSRILRLTSTSHVRANDPRLRLSPRLLDSFQPSRETNLQAGRASAFKRWLGLRYDRPAVPEDLVEIGRAIASAVQQHRTQARSDGCHDVLFQARPGSPPTFELAAIVTDAADRSDVTSWMVEAALAIPPVVGLMSTAPIVATKSEISISWVDDSYAANLSNITWKKPEPQGAQ